MFYALAICDNTANTSTAFLKAKGGTSFNMYEDWRKLSFDEQCLWSMEGRWLNKENDEERNLRLWTGRLYGVKYFVIKIIKSTRSLFLLSKIASYEPKTGALGSARLDVTSQRCT